ncbi:MAG: hypothetical protein J6Y54_03800 [Lentisphaeria bacterium]|nr:hypothetical protein [Lentisphaeria bacterium]
MNLKKILTCGMAAAAMLTQNLGAEESRPAQAPKYIAPQKIMLLIADVGTIDTVAKTEEYLTQIKQFNVDEIPRPSAGTAATDPNFSRMANRNEYFIEINNYKAKNREIAARNRRMEKVLEGLRNSILVNGQNRDIVVAKDYLQSYFMPYREYIGIVDRSNSSIAEVEKMIGGQDQVDVAASTYFLTVVMQDLKEESNTVQVGNTMVKRTVYTRKAVAKVRDYNGNVLFALNVVGKATHRRTSATQNKGHDPASDIMEDLLKQIADRVAAEFLCKLTIKAKGPKTDADFDADTIVLFIDGKEFENGGIVIAGNHLLLAQCEGYKDIVRPVEIKGGKKRIIAVKFAKAAPKQDQDASGQKADPESK